MAKCKALTGSAVKRLIHYLDSCLPNANLGLPLAPQLHQAAAVTVGS